MPLRLVALYALFAISGFCGLIYESIWAQYLKLFLGHAAYAQSVVLVVFIGGMSFGAWLCGCFAERLRSPLLAYAGAEFIVGVFAIKFHDLFVWTTQIGYDWVLPATCDATGFCVSSWLLAAALILPQSILLGTTFPLMTAGVLRAFPQQPGSKVAFLYFLNSLGAAVGVLVSIFVLVPKIGLPGASLTAGLMNVALAIGIYFLYQKRLRGHSQQLPETAREDQRPEVRSWLLAIAAFTGLSSFMYEIVWIRMLSLVLGASIHSFELMLASFILGLALGGLWIRRHIDALERPIAALAAVQIVMGILALSTLPLFVRTFDAMAWLFSALGREASSYVLFNVASSAIALAVMLPTTIAAGMTLPLITYALLRGHAGERAIGQTYAANTLGSIVGVLLAVHVGLPMLGLEGTLVTAAGIDVLLGVALIAFPLRNAPRAWWRPALAAAGVGALVAVPVAIELDPLRLASGVYRTGSARLDESATVAFHRDGKTATVAVIDYRDGPMSIKTNGKTDATLRISTDAPPISDEYTMTLLAALPLALKPDARTAAVIGFGSGLTTHTLLGTPTLQRVDTIEIEPAMIEGARQFGHRVERAYTDARSRIIVDDAKSFFARSREKYDLIISEPSNPWVAGVASLFTTEFYRRLRNYLADDGLLVQWIQMYEFDDGLLGSITSALADSFPEFTVYAANASDLLLVARMKGKVGEVFGQVFRAEPLAGELRRLGIESPADFDVRRIAGSTFVKQAHEKRGYEPNSDYFPLVELRAPEARFRNLAASYLPNLVLAPVPLVEMLEHEPVGDRGRVSGARRGIAPQIDAVLDAQATVDLLLATVHGTNEPIPPHHPYAQSIAVTRMLLADCVNAANASAAWDHVLTIAIAINPHLPAARVDQVWKALGESACLKRLPEEYRIWIRLFRSVGNRDAAAMARDAEALLGTPGRTPGEFEYLVIAAATGYLAAGNPTGARRVLKEAFASMPSDRRALPWFVLLGDLSRG